MVLNSKGSKGWLLWWLTYKESAYNAEDAGSILGLRRFPGGGSSSSLQCSCLARKTGSLGGYSPWDCKELDMTEWLNNKARVSTKDQWSLCLVVVTLWTAPHQAPLFMGFSRQEYWSGLPFPSPNGSLIDP